MTTEPLRLAAKTTIELEELFDADPDLAEVDASLHTEDRRPLLSVAPKGGVGAELGVFTGKFSECLYADTRPNKLYLVDVWHTRYGDKFPDWGRYTANGRLSTKAALAAAQTRAATMNGVGTIVISRIQDWLKTLPSNSLDWAYIDSSHSYHGTYDEIESLMRVLKPNGVIMGDDCRISTKHKHHGVFRAVRDHALQGKMEIIWMDGVGQWALRWRTDAS